MESRRPFANVAQGAEKDCDSEVVMDQDEEGVLRRGGVDCPLFQSPILNGDDSLETLLVLIPFEGPDYAYTDNVCQHA